MTNGADTGLYAVAVDLYLRLERNSPTENLIDFNEIS